MNKKAFTLAEVLVTLVIIGVISAITIPSLSQNTKSNEYVTGCLKAYSVLSGAINRMKVDLGPIGLGSKWNTEGEFWKEFSKQLNTVSVSNSNSSTCPRDFYKGLNGTRDDDNSGYTLITTDGMCINYSAKKCTNKGVDTENCMGRFLVDVNGQKGPNVFGRDVFFFALKKGDGIVPAGIDNNSANCKKNGSGIDCAAKVINEKKIDYK